MRCPKAWLPRVIVVHELSRPMEASNLVTLRVFAPARPRDPADLVASAVVASGDARRRGGRGGDQPQPSRQLLPFAAKSLERVRVRPPRWDVEDGLADPPPGGGWPGESEIRLALPASPSTHSSVASSLRSASTGICCSAGAREMRSRPI